MDQTTDQLVVRQHFRHACSLPARVRVEEQHAQRISVAIQSPGCAGGEFDATVIDCSEGGLGLRSPVFIPKGGRLVVRIDPGDKGPTFETVVRVMRAEMVDRGPTYYLGSSLASESPQTDAGMRRIAAAATCSKAAPHPRPEPKGEGRHA